FHLLTSLRHLACSALSPYTTLLRSAPQPPGQRPQVRLAVQDAGHDLLVRAAGERVPPGGGEGHGQRPRVQVGGGPGGFALDAFGDRKSTRLNSSHVKISYAVFGLTN